MSNLRAVHPDKQAAVHRGDSDDDIFAYWAAGWDTSQIAAALGVPEADVANRLPKMLDARRGRQRTAVGGGDG
jgi:hypothetical protein